MAMVPEAAMRLDGTVMRVSIDHDDKGNAYGTVQVSNNDGISDVSFNADATRDMQVATLAPGTPVAWVVRPFVVCSSPSRLMIGGWSARSCAWFSFRLDFRFSGVAADGIA